MPEQPSPIITRAQNGVITAHLSISNAPVSPVAQCPKPGAGLSKVFNTAAGTAAWFGVLRDAVAPLVKIAPRVLNAGVNAMVFGSDSPLRAMSKAGTRGLVSQAVSFGMKDFREGMAFDVGVAGVVGGLTSLERNIPKLMSKEISPANFAGRVGFGVAQGAVKGAVNSAAWAGTGAVSGAVIGGVFGLVGGPPGAIAGAIVGARVGAFVGTTVGPLFDKAVLGGKVEKFTDSVAEKILPAKYEESVGRFADRTTGAVAGAMSGAMSGISKGWGAASNFLHGH